jgi:hypothetical protein
MLRLTRARNAICANDYIQKIISFQLPAIPNRSKIDLSSFDKLHAEGGIGSAGDGAKNTISLCYCPPLNIVIVSVA